MMNESRSAPGDVRRAPAPADSVLLRRLAPVVSLLLVLVTTPTILCLAFTRADAQTGVGQGPRVSLGSDAKGGQRYIESRARRRQPIRRSSLSCDGRRWTLSLTRSEDSAIYTVSVPRRADAERVRVPRVPADPRDRALPRAAVGRVGEPAQGQELQRPCRPGRRVLDRSTILVNLGERAETVRYVVSTRWGQTAGRRYRGRPGRALQANRQLVARQQVRMELDTVERDRDGRLLAYVYVADTMVNAPSSYVAALPRS